MQWPGKLPERASSKQHPEKEDWVSDLVEKGPCPHSSQFPFLCPECGADISITLFRPYEGHVL